MNYYISDDKDKIQIDKVVEMLNKTYWAATRPRKVIEESIKNSVCYGVYERDNNHIIGFARVITDYATTYYLCDVIIDESYRGNGIGKALLKKIVSDPRYVGLRALLLTKDAHNFYRQFGFQEEPSRFMWKINE